MQSIEEQKQEIKRRKQMYAEQKALRRRVIFEVVASAAVVLLIVVAAILVPTLDRASEEVPVRQYGSLILSVPVMGYVVFGILAFGLGVLATFLCRDLLLIRRRKAAV